MRAVSNVLRGFGPSGGALPGPDVPEFSVVDNADGTVTVSISGSSAGSQNTWNVQRVDGELGGGQWTVAGSRSGDGDIVSPLAAGYYFGRVVSTRNQQSVSSAAVYFRATTGSDAIYAQVLEAAQARIQSLLLEGIPNQHVVILKTAEFQEPDVPGLPAVLLVPAGHEAMPQAAGTNGRDDVTYSVRVIALAAGNQEPSALLDLYLAWREAIARAFRRQRLPGVPSVIDTFVEPEAAIDAEAWWHQYDAGSLRLNFIAREPRGFGA